MKVITFDTDKLRAESLRLGRMVLDAGFRPDLVVAILSGGKEVAECMAPVFPTATFAEVSTARPGTAAKRRMSWLRRLPYALTNLMRMAEALWLERRPSQVRHVGNASSLPPSAAKILVVDDSVDSGQTLLAAQRFLHDKYPDAELRSAAVTQTTTSPECKPDHCLYRDRILIRFPWAPDAKTR